MGRILMLCPSLISGWASYREKGNNESSYMDHGLAMLSAVLKKAGHETFCMDLRSFQHWNHFEDVLKEQKFDLTMVSFFSANEIYARKALEIVKKHFPDKYIIGGGVHLSVTQTREYPNIDSIVLGEGENHIIGIVDTILQGNAPEKVYESSPVKNLDTLPYVDRHLFNPRMEQTSPLLAGLPTPFITMVAGRGCWGKCTFCYPSRNLISGNKIRIRSVDHFIGELVEINKNVGGIGSIMIHDDLLGNNKWMEEFIEKWNKNLKYTPWWCQLRADSVIKMKEYIPALADMGLSYVSMGLESGSQRMLDFLNKGTTVEQNIEAAAILHENGVNIFANYITCLPTETKEDLDGTEKMLSIIKPAFHSACVYTSYPGNQLYNYVVENKCWLEPEEHYSKIRYPFERKIKGINYIETFKRGIKWREQYTGQLRTPKRLNSHQVKIDLNKVLNPKASIIVVTYNRPEMLKEALESAFSQTMQDFEIIVNDYTEDHSVNQAIYEQYVNDPRVRWLKHDKNINNISLCWNECLDIIKGQYWCTLDDDNKKYPEFLEKTISFLEKNPQHEAVVVPMEHAGSSSGIFFTKPKSHADLMVGNRIDSGQVVYRKSILEKIGNFDERLVAYEDWDYMIRVHTLNNKSGTAFGWLSGPPLCNYRWHKGKRMWDKEIEKTYEGITKTIKKKKVTNIVKIKCEVAKQGVTESQKQLATEYINAIQSLNCVETVVMGADFVFLIGPLFNYTEQDLVDIKSDNRDSQFVALLMEDPQALNQNITYHKYLDWIVTNDTNAYDYYIKNVRENKRQQVLHWNNMSLSENMLKFIDSYNPKKEYDVCFVGYPYPSRIDFMKEILPGLKDKKIVLIGDTWSDQKFENVTTFKTMGEIEAAKIAMKSRITLIKHRDHKDMGGFKLVAPSAASGSVTIDDIHRQGGLHMDVQARKRTR